MLTKLEQIDEIIKLALHSAYIKGEDQPVSGLIVGEPELGKTEELKQAILLAQIRISFNCCFCCRAEIYF